MPGPDLGAEGTIKKLLALVGHPDLLQSWLSRLSLWELDKLRNLSEPSFPIKCYED